jgi:HEPN domain-containing protein
MRRETEAWWRQAEADFVTARVLMDAKRYYAASWFAQQSVEKALKALFLQQTASQPPRTHDLELLGRRVQIASGLVPDLVVLNPAIDITRYPAPPGFVPPVAAVSESLAGQHLGAAERVIRWIASELNAPLNLL